MFLDRICLILISAIWLNFAVAGAGVYDLPPMVYFLSILMLIVHQRYTVYFGFYQTEFDFAQVGLLLLYLSLALALVSAGEYFKLFVDAVEAKEERLQAAS